MPSLIELYDDYEKDKLINEIRQFESVDTVVPVRDLIHILSDTMDIELNLLILEIFYLRLKGIDDELISIYPTVSDILKKHLIQLFALSKTSKHMMFLIGEYFNDPYMRPLIRKLCFDQPFYLFINLVRYFEDIPLSKDAVETAQQILRTIPRDVILKSGNSFSGTKLMDVYFAMPPENRKK